MTPSIHPQRAQAPGSGLPLSISADLDPPLAAAGSRPAHSLALMQALQQAWPALARDEEALLALAALGRSHRIRQRGRLLRDGSSNEDGSLWLLVRGKLSMGRRAAKGQWRQSRALHGGQWIDLASAWPGVAYPETALALTPVLAHEFPARAMLALCHEHPSLLLALLGSLGRHACEAQESRQALTTQDFPARLAEWLLQQHKLRGCGDCLSLGQLKRDLAAQLGVTPETLSRTLRQFHEQGLIVMQHSELRIPEPARLAALGQRPADGRLR